MSIKVLYVDLRNGGTQLESYTIAWENTLTAQKALETALGVQELDRINDDLEQDNRNLVISWSNLHTGETSDIGGVYSLDWPIPDNSIVAVVYEDASTTDEQMDTSNEWMLAEWNK